jgi:hypothetical protein
MTLAVWRSRLHGIDDGMINDSGAVGGKRIDGVN